MRRPAHTLARQTLRRSTASALVSTRIGSTQSARDAALPTPVTARVRVSLVLRVVARRKILATSQSDERRAA